MEIRTRKSNTHLIVILEGHTKENGEEALIDELMTQNFPELMKDRNPQIHEVPCNLGRLNRKKHTGKLQHTKDWGVIQSMRDTGSSTEKWVVWDNEYILSVREGILSIIALPLESDCRWVYISLFGLSYLWVLNEDVKLFLHCTLHILIFTKCGLIASL